MTAGEDAVRTSITERYVYRFASAPFDFPSESFGEAHFREQARAAFSRAERLYGVTLGPITIVERKFADGKLGYLARAYEAAPADPATKAAP